MTTFVVKRVKKTNFYDCFKGLGWKDWTRFSYPQMKIVAGSHLPRVEVAKVFHTIEAQIASSSSQLAGVKHK